MKTIINRIASRSNPKVKDLVKQKDGYYFFEGDKLVMDILNKGIPIEILLVHEDREATFTAPAKSSIKDTWFVNDNVMTKITTLKERPGFIAVLAMKPGKINFAKSRAVIALDNLQDPANAGTIFRCAAAFGIESVAFSGASVKPSNSKFLRAAQNAFFDVNFQHFDSVESLLKKASSAGLNIYLTSSHASADTVGPKAVRFPCLIVLGNEGQGLPEHLFDKYPSLKIAQTGKVESLNVGVCACIIMHELKKLASGKGLELS